MSSQHIQASQATVPDQQTIDSSPFPLVWLCESDAVQIGDVAEWVSVRKDELVAQAHEHGAVLFRGFGLSNAEDFDQFIAAFGLENFPYEQSLSNAVRVNYTPRVFSANEAPPDVTIYLHHEMAQTPIFPSKLFFFCEKAADEGGATPLCRSDVLYQQMLERLPDFARCCEQKGLQYSNVMPGADDATSGMGRSWQSTFGAQSREEAQQRMRSLGYIWQWLDDGCLRATTPVLPAVRKVGAGRRVFFNQLIAAFRGWKDTRNDPAKAITFGDGSPLDRDEVLQVAEMAEQLTFDLQWQSGDVALVDNFIAMHGRRTFAGTRKVLASLVCAQRHEAIGQ